MAINKDNYTILFAEFLGYKIKWIDDTSVGGKDSYPLFIKDGMTTDSFSLTWENLMAVVEKIEEIGHTSVEIVGNTCIITPILYDSKTDSMKWYSKIRSLYDHRNKRAAVLYTAEKFLLWYNDFKKEKKS